MTAESENKRLPSGRVRRPLVLFLKQSFGWFLAGVAVLWLSSFLLIGSVAERKIRQACGGAVHVQSGRLTLSGAVRLKGVAVAADATTLAQRPIFQADRVELTADPWSLLRGRFQLRAVELDHFLLTADYDTSTDQWNFEQLAMPTSTSTGGVLPLILVQRGTVQISRRNAAGLTAVTTFGLDGQIVAAAGEGRYDFGLAADGRFGFAGSVCNGSLTLGDDGGRLAMDGRLRMPNATILDNAWNLTDIRLDVAWTDRQVTLHRCGFSMGDGTAELQGAIEAVDDHHQLDLTVNLRHMTLSDRVQPDALVYSGPVLDVLDPRVRRFLTRFHPRGTGDLDLSIRGRLDDLSATTLNGTVRCRDIAVRDATFPYAMEGLTGQIELSGRDLALTNLAGTHGDVVLRIDGTINDIGPNAVMDIRLQSPNMRFDDDLYRALSEPVQKVWFAFSPSGRAGLDYRFQKAPDGTRETTLTLALTDAGLVYDQFPYPLEHLTGTITYDPNAVDLTNLAAHYPDDRKVVLNGRVSALTSGRPDFEIHVEAERIPVDAVLIQAMPPAQRALLEPLSLDASSRADLDVSVRRGASDEGPLDVTAQVTLDASRLVYAGFPVPVTDVHLAATVTRESLALTAFEGTAQGGRVTMSGRMTPAGKNAARPAVCLDVDLDAFNLNETFWAAVGADANDFLGDLRPQGPVEVTGHLAFNPAESDCSPTDVVIRCSDNPLMLDGRDVARVGGRLHWVDDMLTVEGLSVTEMDLAAMPTAWLSEAMRTVYGSLEPSGTLAVMIRHGQLTMGPDGPRRAELNGALVLTNAAAGPGRRVHQLDGAADGQIQADFETGQCRVLAKYAVDHFLWRDYWVRDVQGHLAYDSTDRQLESRGLTAELYDGAVTGDFELDLSDPNKAAYVLATTLTGANVAELLAAGDTQAAEKVIDGRVSATLNLTGDLKDPPGREGTVTVEVRQVKLGRQSLMGKILTAMRMRTPQEFIFDAVEVDGSVRGEAVLIHSVRLLGDPLVFHGSGRLDLDTQQMAMEFAAYDRLVGDKETLFDRLARGFGKALWKIEVRGDIRQPTVNAVFLSFLKQPLDLFKSAPEPEAP